LYLGFRPTYIAVRWTKGILEENWNQGDKEKWLNIPTTRLTDRSFSGTKNNSLNQVFWMNLFISLFYFKHNFL
jgi:hypothetical protein